jgi:hypothetical protein
MKRALVLSLAIVLGLGIFAFAQDLSGTWNTTIKIDPTQGNFATAIDFSTDLTVVYEVAGWTFTSFTEIKDTGWSDQTFSASGALGAFSFGSTLDLNPTGLFDKWNVTAGVSIAGMSFDLDFTLADQDITLVLTGSGSAGLVDITVAVTFGDNVNDPFVDVCDLNWAGVKITAGFPFCCAEVDFTMEFDCTGFLYAQFCVSDIVIPNLPWVTVGACLKYELQTKTLVLDADFDFGADVCFDLYIGVEETGNLTIGDIYIDGIGLICEIGGVSFEGISFWGTHATKPADLGAYWEMYRISTTDDGCCGPFDFDVAVFFDDDGNSLFEVDKFEANMSLEVAAQFTFTMGLDYTVGTGATLWELGFVVTW